MPVAQLLELAKSEKYEDFEARCLELLESGELPLSKLVSPFEQFARGGNAERLATLAQMIFETVDPQQDPQPALKLVRAALHASPKSEGLRDTAVTLYQRVYGETPGFDQVLAASGIQMGRPVRSALRVLDFSLELNPGDALISRADDRVVEIVDIDRGVALFTLRSEGRISTLPAQEVVREYDRIASDDFRVLRGLKPDRLTELIQEDPVAVVVGLIHAHGEMIDADLLKHELVPRYIPGKDWSRWWTRARTALKRNPHVIIEGRNPMILSFSSEGQTLEEDALESIQSQRDPIQWLATIEGYLREKKSLKEEPDAGLLIRFHDHMADYIETVRTRRGGSADTETLTCALVLEHLTDKGLILDDRTTELPVRMLQEATDPGLMLRGVQHEGLRERGLTALRQAHPNDWVQHTIAWLPTAPATLLDTVVGAALDADRTADVQRFIDTGLASPASHPELLYWLWKGPKKKKGLRLPTDAELFDLILNELSTLGRTVAAEPDVVKEFRQRMKSVLSLRNYARAKAVIEQTNEANAVTMRRQLMRLEGLGENVRAKLLDLLRDVHPVLWVVKQRRIEPWEDRETIWTTTAGLNRHVAERDEVMNVKMPENAKRIGEAASHGDLSENSEYKFALEERDLLRARLAKLNDDISRASEIDPLGVATERVNIGTRVRIRRVDTGDEHTMTFLGPFDTNVEQGIYSYLAPVSQKLMGAHPGDRIPLTFDNVEAEYEITKIENALAST